jgi:3-(3-hydroxy-phenyl)propionate hydroxylase
MRHPVVIVGAGPVGLSAAIDLKVRGVPVVVVDDDNTVSEGSRAIAYAKRTLEIWNRMGAAQRVRSKGVGWELGKVFYRSELLYEFTMKANDSQEMPAFVNLQQYYVEEYLVDRCVELGVEIRWQTRLVGVEHSPGAPVTLELQTPEGAYKTTCDWLIAADGARSQVRKAMGLGFKGHVFNERFLIMDIRMLRAHPAERWFWFDPPFNPNHSALLHMQADNVWRVGNQLGIRLDADFDAEYEKSPARVNARIRAMLGEDLEFEVEWVSIFTFQCRRLERFVHDRVVFVGDAAHQVSPFGGRGANSGVQDTDNLAWKLKLVIDGKAPAALLDSYEFERGQAADENILVSTRATDFVTPKNQAAHVFRHAVLTLARTQEFARPMVNSGRLSVPTVYADSPLSTPDSEDFSGSMRPGVPCLDAPLSCDGSMRQSWLLHQFTGDFYGVFYGHPAERERASAMLSSLPAEIKPVWISPKGSSGDLVDSHGVFAELYDARPGNFYLIRPDQHVAARWRVLDHDKVARALDRACARL